MCNIYQDEIVINAAHARVLGASTALTLFAGRDTSIQAMTAVWAVRGIDSITCGVSCTQTHLPRVLTRQKWRAKTTVLAMVSPGL